ncbi:unnamed protein product, partial [Prorocentrum cordatum]
PVRVEPGAAGSAASAAAEQALALLRRQRRVRDPLARPAVRPGVVYGFDDETAMAADAYQQWQHDAACLRLPHRRAGDYAEAGACDAREADHLGLLLRALLDPPPHALGGLGAAPEPAGPGHAAGGLELQVVHGASGAAEAPGEAAPPGEALQAPPPAVGGEDCLGQAPWLGQAGPVPEQAGELAGELGPEAQDERTAEVGRIIRNCLRADPPTVAFHTLVPPGGADRATAASTFAAVLALASAGELRVQQDGPYGDIVISEP